MQQSQPIPTQRSTKLFTRFSLLDKTFESLAVEGIFRLKFTNAEIGCGHAC